MGGSYACALWSARLRLIGFDYMMLFSLDRHATAGLVDVGTPKVRCVARELRSITPFVQVEARNLFTMRFNMVHTPDQPVSRSSRPLTLSYTLTTATSSRCTTAPRHTQHSTMPCHCGMGRCYILVKGHKEAWIDIRDSRKLFVKCHIGSCTQGAL
ncbi:hypothetical protein V8E53_002848 [Lactarius tabidus]